MASIFGVSQSAYSAWERGVKEPSIITICSICNHFGISADWLLGLSDAASASVPAARAEPAGESEAYWRDLVASQQAVIRDLAAALAAGRAGPAVAPAGGRAATKTA
jgi:transcriptional regulator with XRE-family HTH domain